MSKKSPFRGHFGEQHGERQQALLKSTPHHLLHSYWSLWRRLGQKKSLLMTCKVLKLFVNTLTAHDKYYLRNRNNLMEPVKKQLSQTQETFSNFFFFFSFFKFTLNFESFPTKRNPDSWCISEITNSEKRD